MVCGDFGSLVWGIGSSEHPSLRAGKMDPLILFSSVTVTLELGRLSSGTKGDVLINSYTLLTSGIFSSLVIDTLRSRARERKFHVFHLYCDYLAHKERTAVDLIARLLKQALARLDRIPEKVSLKFEESEVPGSDRVRPLLQDVADMLDTVLASFERVFICIDALDEFPPLQRPDLLRCLAKLTRQSKTRLFLTGRPQIQHDKKHLGKGAQTLSIKARKEEIKAYIARRLDEDQNSAEMSTQLRIEIMETLPHKVSRMYVGVVIFYARSVSSTDNHV